MDFEAHDRAIISDLEADLAAARAEIERLNKERDQWRNDCLDANQSELMLRKRAEKAEAERDEARSQVAAAYEAAAKRCYEDQGRFDTPDRIRALTPADAKAALEAYGREKVREGMQRSASIGYQVCAETRHVTLGDKVSSAILAEMEKEGGE